ncbi:MAG TPA: adenine phosphoribosyltransferase [Solirubrobacterales bacterium]|nr:adenine phosphoribosyltransferase [Solirubrobacterales bacterium]
MPPPRTLEVAELRALIRSVPDFPRPGICFRDATPLFADPAALRSAVDLLAERVEPAGPVDVVVGAEARGFILGPALAVRLGAGFVLARREGRLPAATEREAYELEYGEAELHVHTDAIAPGARVLVHDDLIATGGTAAALGALAHRLGGEVVAYAFLIELLALRGRDRLAAPTQALIAFDD